MFAGILLPESSAAWDFIRCGSLGMLHMEIIQERLGESSTCLLLIQRFQTFRICLHPKRIQQRHLCK
jgi:translation elongation factor EF-4